MGSLPQKGHETGLRTQRGGGAGGGGARTEFFESAWKVEGFTRPRAGARPSAGTV